MKNNLKYLSILVSILIIAILIAIPNAVKAETIEDIDYLKEIEFKNLKELNINNTKCLANFDLYNNTVNDIINYETEALGECYTLKFYKNDDEITGNSKVGTGTIIKVLSGDIIQQEYTVILYGDVTGNGNPSAIDALAVIKNKLDMVKFSNEIYEEAGRVTEITRSYYSIPNAVDALSIVKYKLGTENIEQDTKNKLVDIETIKLKASEYANKHYGVTIINGIESSDEDYGTIIARFDETTESIVNNWENYLQHDVDRCQGLYDYLTDLGNKGNINLKYRDYNDLTKLWNKIYDLERVVGNKNITYGTLWLGDINKVKERIQTDFNGTAIQYDGIGTHYGMYPNIGLLEQFKDCIFEEVYLNVPSSNNLSKSEILYIMIPKRIVP